MRKSRLLAVMIFGALWVLGNLGGNYAGWQTIFAWFESANGAATIDPIWTHPLVLCALAIAPSAAQWVREWFDMQDKWKWGIFTFMAADLGINTIGLYVLVMGKFTFPPVWPIFAFLAALAFIPNVFCQSLATLNLKELLKEQAAKPAKSPAKPVAKAELPLANDIVPANRRTNGSVPLQIEDAKP